MSLRAIHTCTGCVPVDRSIIDAYVGLLNINTNVSAAEAARVESEEDREQQFSADHARAVADHDAVAAATTAATNAASAATNAATAANTAASGASYAATYATEAADAASEAVDEARDAADAAAETASKSPYIGGNGKWFVYDPKDQDYVDTNIKARGDKGDKGDTGEQGPQGIQGERGPAGVTSVEVSVSPSTGTPSGSGSVTDGVLSLSFSGLKGETGAQGATGAQGPQGPQGAAGVGFASVASQQDGTLVITLTNGDTVTIDLNHNHSQYEETTNKVTSISSSSTDTQYPSAKCVYDIIGNIETLLAAL